MQCAALLLLTTADRAAQLAAALAAELPEETPGDQAQATRALPGHLAGERIGLVYCSHHAADAEAAAAVAAALKVPCRAQPGLEAPGLGTRALSAPGAAASAAEGPGSEGSDAAGLRSALESIADLHRGESILVVASDVLGPVLPALARDTRGLSRGQAGTVLLECGDDGWFLRAWPDGLSSGSG